MNICLTCKNDYKLIHLNRVSKKDLYLKVLYKVFNLLLSPYVLLILSLIYSSQELLLPKVFFQFWITCCCLTLLYTSQDALLYMQHASDELCYFVPKPDIWNPEEVYITTSDNEKIHGYFYKVKDAIVRTVPTVLFLHGNAGKILKKYVTLINLICLLMIKIIKISLHYIVQKNTNR